MFFLERGTVHVVPSNGSTVVATLVAGSFFGETSLFLKQPRASSVCAATFCDIFELNRTDLFNELQRRDFDLVDTLKTFSCIHDENSRRNKAIQKSLLDSRTPGTKLNKLIHSDPTTRNRKVLEIFMPGSVFSFFFDAACMVLTIYFLMSVPYRVAFREEGGGGGRIVLFDLVADVFFIADLYLRSTRFTFMRDGSICTDNKAILQRYLKSGMSIDAISCLSVMEIFAPRLQLRLLSLLRILRIPFFHRTIRLQLSLRGIRLSLATNVLGRMTLLYVLSNHWAACFWFIIHRYVERRAKYTWATTDCPWGAEVGSDGCLAKWNETLGEHNVCNMDSYQDCYLRSLHFSLATFSTVGYGDISPVTIQETLFEFFLVLCGACYMACFIGAFGVYLSEGDTMGFNSFKDKIQKLKKYLHYRNIPEDIQTSIIFFHHCRWRDSQTLDERQTLSILPEQLQLDISFAVKQRVICLVPILDSLSDIVQKRIAHALILQVYSIRDNPIIYSQGDIGWEIYFVASGVVSITLPTDFTELDTAGRANAAANKEKFDSIGLILGAGNHVGESCLCSESGVRQETVLAGTTKVELYALSKENLTDICRLMGPEKGRNFMQALLTRNKKNWHSFDKVEGIADIWGESANAAQRQEQNSLGRNHSFFPWSTPNTAEPNARGTTVRRRRMSRRSSSQGTIEMVLKELQNEQNDSD
eukprot:CAMPEP_0181132250 /NCGR_PEP_ID=MMETSP1071-20121207/30896_1 /TAXON_ID=35127 /ORGANISM="Thalassiosira sp., Strain NH16" /LENGTH=700 /DNA_ID=CAMNT_0023218573 /DNA_START=240 /DNA_END=2342 /DNA_ORIENTATION=+